MNGRQHTFISGLILIGLSLASLALLAQQDHGQHAQEDGSGQEQGNGGGMMNPNGQNGGRGGGMNRNGRPPHEHERVFKDPVKIGPDETVKIVMEFAHFSGPELPYMYHCHILEHDFRHSKRISSA
jgi:hypothetical protein